LIVGCYANKDDDNNEKGGGDDDDDDDGDDDDTLIKLMVGTTESITKSFRKYLSNTLGKFIMRLQKTAVLDTAHVLGEVLMHKYKMFIVGNNIICTVGCSHGIAVLLYTPRVYNISVII
jgi:hypothetical protein